ncbi:MAG: hypothetical protein M0009_02875 [Deltaproteobacteria bacterium]|nr:hypothetical protein [Deltaproteobacteria bacterium]
MNRAKKVTFNQYRYQILPTTQAVQTDFCLDIKGVEDLRAKKNEFFKRSLSEIQQLSYPRGPILHRKLLLDDEILLIQLAVERDLQRTTREFKDETVENWPDILIAMNNNPHIQTCLIEQGGGFQDTATVAKLLSDNLNALLLRYQLYVAFEPIYEKKVFWDLVRKYEGRITQIEFELISPNMSNISGALTIDLGALNRNTNTQRTNIQLNSDKSSALTPTENDPLVSGLVDYASQGGGDIAVRAKGVSKKIHTARGVNEVYIDEILLKGSNPELLRDIFKDIMR